MIHRTVLPITRLKTANGMYGECKFRLTATRTADERYDVCEDSPVIRLIADVRGARSRRRRLIDNPVMPVRTVSGCGAATARFGRGRRRRRRVHRLRGVYPSAAAHPVGRGRTGSSRNMISIVTVARGGAVEHRHSHGVLDSRFRHLHVLERFRSERISRGVSGHVGQSPDPLPVTGKDHAEGNDEEYEDARS